MPDGTGPALRTDAQRNRALLLEAARTAFSSAGREKVSLEGIARQAGVGIGTLYRHFPTREALVEAVFRTQLDALCAEADELLARLPPAEALRAWMDRYAAFVATKRGMAQTLRTLITTGSDPRAGTRERLTGAVQTLLDAGVLAGTLRADVRAADVSTSLTGVLLATEDSGDPEQVGRMLDLLADGLRVRS